MVSTDVEGSDCELQELSGSLNAIDALKSELELRLEEARDDCVREVLDNIIALVDAREIEYRRRREELRARL